MPGYVSEPSDTSDGSQTMKWQSRVRLVDEVADVLRERIYEGRYALGAPLRQEQLAGELDVSRTPLREALRLLEREGLVTVLPGRGVRVVSGDVDRLLAAYGLREVVDGLAARLAAERSTPELHAALEQILSEQRRAVADWNPGVYTASNVRFHAEIVRGAGNEYVEAQLPLVRMTSQVFTPVKLVELERAQQAVQEHEVIAAAIASGDSERAEGLARAHIHNTIDSLSQRDHGTQPLGRSERKGRGD